MTRASVVVLLMALACRPSGARDARDFERMRRQQRYDLYDTSRFFRNGAVVQSPPAHTIDRDPILAAQGQVASLAFSTGTSAGSDVVDIPVPIDDRVRRLGADHFRVSCVPCHGDGGFGGGPIAPNLGEKRPPSLRTPTVSSMPAGMLFRIITDGVGRMPPYGWQLPPATRWAVVAHVRSLSALSSTEASRSDSARAASLRQLDSLHAAHADLGTILRVQGRTP
ncbi:MAG: c-type cytochrome [Gemmatimonadaceae bacterium]